MVPAAPRPTLRTREARALRRVASRVLPALLLIALASGAGCQHPGPAVSVGAPVGEAAARVRHAGVGAFEDPTVGNARLVPERLDPGVLSDAEPDGARRGVVAGYRVLVANDGAVRVSEDRLTAVPASSLAIPARLGGGHLFVVGTTVLRADSWLSEARPVYTARAPIQKVFAGLDRVYVRTARGHVAIDAATGAPRDLGPYPPGPELFAYGATDGWRAAALSDLSGLVATGDAGATWRRVDAGFQVRDVTVTPLGKLVVSGVERGRAVAAELRERDELVRLPVGSATGGLREGPSRGDAEVRPSARPEVRVFGPRPLLAAIEDGWPLTDGVALVARDGALGRVRLSDGALVEAVPDAFPLSPARCRGVSLNRPAAKGAFGFVCGEPRGRTDLYAYDPSAGRLVLLRRFDSPRVVLSSGNGALAVRGSCGVDVADPPKQQTYCILDHGDRFREVRVRGDVGSERVAVLANRTVAILSPPVASAASGGELGTARLTLLDARGEAKTVALSFPRLDANVARALRFGVWLDPVEERRPGVLGAWVDAGGSVVGLEIGVDGAVKVGQHVREAGFPTVSGRYGFGYTNTRRLYETSDGGMTWRSEEVPEPLVPLSKVASRAVGPIGAAAAGWLRVGWGAGSKAASREAKAPHLEEVPARATSPLLLECDALAPTPTLPAAQGAPKPRVPASRSGPMVRPQPLHALLSSPYGSPQVRELTPFFATAPPKVREGERVALNTAVFESLSQLPRSRSFAHVYAWGPHTPTQEPDASTRLLVRWLSPFDGYSEVHSTAPTPLPASLLEAMRAPTPSFPHAYTMYSMQSTQWKVAVSDDGRHALLASRLGGVGLRLWELESGRGPIEVRPADGAEIPEVESVVRAEGRWVIAVAHAGTAADPEAGSDLLVIDGGVARRLARVPRAGSRHAGRLARRTDGRSVGYVLEASGAASRGSPERWVVPVDLETGAVGSPALLGDPEYAGVALGACVGDEPGYVLEVPLAAGLRVRLGGAGRLATLSNALGRVRVSPGRACVEAAAGNVVGDGAFVVRKGPAAVKRGGLPVGAVWGNLRYPLSCAVVQ